MVACGGRRRERGFTLVELMVALVLFSVAVAGVLAVAVSMSSAFRDQRMVLATEGAAVSPMDYLTDSIRQASPGVASGLITDCQRGTTVALSTVNSSTAPDSLDVIYASGGAVTATQALWAGTAATIPVANSTGIAVNDYVVVTDNNTGLFVKVTGVAAGSLTLASCANTTNMPSGGYPSTSMVIRALHATFTIGTTNGIPSLLMASDSYNTATLEPLADGVEDMQIALGIDSTLPLDDVITEVGSAANDDEWQGNVLGDGALTGNLRAVRVTMVARAAKANSTGATPFVRPKAEDHAAGTVADQFRRRVLQATVEVRNYQGSP